MSILSISYFSEEDCINLGYKTVIADNGEDVYLPSNRCFCSITKYEVINVRPYNDFSGLIYYVDFYLKTYNLCFGKLKFISKNFYTAHSGTFCKFYNSNLLQLTLSNYAYFYAHYYNKRLGLSSGSFYSISIDDFFTLFPNLSKPNLDSITYPYQISNKILTSEYAPINLYSFT